MEINNFNGIAPRFDDNLKPGYATTAENIDLSNGKIRPVSDDLLIEANTTSVNSIFYHSATWYSGADKYYLSWRIGDYDLLIYLTAGVPYKTVGSVSAPLGQTRLVAPTLADGGAGLLDDTYSYFITTTRSVGGYTDESGPSAVASITVALKQVTVTAPTISDSLVTFWNIYRISNSSGEYQFVAQVAAATSSYTDNIIDADLDTAPTVFYTSDQGNEITWDKPLIAFDGMATDIESGLIMAWKDSTLYWNEPGYPDAWPSFYNMNFPSTIQRVIPFAGSWAIMTEKGPFRVDGTHPELLQQSKVLGKEPCISTAACLTSRGVAYESDSGIVLFNLIDTKVITDSVFTEQWFKDNIDSDSAFMLENDNIIYLFHDDGILIGDSRVAPIIWTTSTIIATAAAVRKDLGELYFLDSAGITQLAGGSGSKTWTWQSGDLLQAGTGADTPVLGTEIIGSGTITATVYVDDLEKKSKALDFAMYRNRRIFPPAYTFGRAAQVKLTGTGQVDEIIHGVTDA